MKLNFTLLLLFLLALSSFGQKQNDKIGINRKKMNVVRTEVAPKIDGFVTDAVWMNAEIGTDFTQLEPNPLEPSKFKTEVRLLYDDAAIYVSFMCFDESGDVVLRQLTERDNAWGGNTDWVAVFFNSYRDGLNGEGFVVSAAGVQQDVKYSSNNEDGSWNAVWESEVQILENGWSAELKIPYAALRFPEQEEQVWVANFARSIRRNREESWWDDINPKIDGYFNQSGELHGIKNIKSPLRLFLYPYVSVNAEHFPSNKNQVSNWSQGFNAGMDLKYGINDAFTLDMTLIPDFGQVRSDNQVLNLSPFEVAFDENRQFFTEGTELFNKGGLFYSRRIGGRPNGFFDVENQLDTTIAEVLVTNPSTTQLINSTKISGRTNKGLGIGLFNSVTGAMFAVAEDADGNERRIKTEDLTNYNIVVFDQNLKNNSFVTLINTNVERFDSERDANVTGAQFSLRNKANMYNVSGNTSFSRVSDELGNLSKGFRSIASVGKISGQFQAYLYNETISKNYNHNDLGFIQRTNLIYNEANLSYNIFEPFGKFNRAGFSVNAGTSHRYSDKAFQDLGLSWNTFMVTRNFFGFGLSGRFEPITTYDYFEPRVDGRYLEYPTNWFIGGFGSSDYRKTFAYDVRFNYRKFNQEGRESLFLFFSPRVRVNDKISFIWDNSFDYNQNDIGWVNFQDGDENLIIMGRRTWRTIDSELFANYTLTNKMGFSLRMRHYWSRADYNSFYLLGEKGTLDATTYSGFNSDGTSIHDRSFNAFNIDLIYNWQFAPGSFMTVVWKNAIYREGSAVDEAFFNNLRNTLNDNPNNSFSIRVIYFLDYLNMVKKRK